MKKQIGGFFSGLIAILVVILLVGTGFLAVETFRERNITKAESLLRSGDYPGAITLFAKADKLSLRPDVRVIRGLAESSLGMEDYESAILYFEKLVKIEPDNVDARYKLGLLYIRAKDYGAAEKEVEALRSIGTERAISGADALSENLATGKIKGFFRDLLKKIAPGLPVIPGITDDGPIGPDAEEPDDKDPNPEQKDDNNTEINLRSGDVVTE